ncbi:MAG: hypothetical protein GXO90_05710 [FCB group bacterium]|nr:hypothetical protein [FCB group bacterium]
MNLFSSIISLFIAPGEFFERFRDESELPDLPSQSSLYWPPVLVLALVGIVSMVFLKDLVRDVQFEQSVSRIENSSRIPEEKKEELMLDMKDRFDNPSTAITVITWGSSLLSLPVRAAFMALMALLIGNFIFGGQARFSTLFGLTAWSYFINIPELIVKIPLMLSKWSFEVYTGLGLLDIGESGSFIHTFLAGIDLFSLWRLILIAIGLGIVYRQGTGKYVGALLILWFLQLSITAGLSAAFN